MEIKKTQQAVSISKAEEDQRADVTKAKPIGQSQTPDSFEIGSSRASGNTGNGSASTEPEKKAGQITGGILIKQLNAARLGEPSVTRESTQQKEIDGKKGLGTDEQNRAGRDSGLEPRNDNHGDLVGSQTGNTGKAETGDNRSSRMERGAELEKLLANSGFDTSRGGGGISSGAGTSSGGGGGVSADANSGAGSSAPPGGAPRGNADAMNNAFNGPTGPGNPMDNFNERQAQRDALQNFASSRSGMMDKLNPESGEQASTGPSKDMISSPGDDYVAGIAEGAGGVGAGAGAVAVGFEIGQLSVLAAAGGSGAVAAAAVGGVAGALGAGLVVGHGVGKLLDLAVEGITGGDETSLGAAAASSGEDARINEQLKEQKKASEKAIAEQKAKNAGTAGTAGTSGTSSSSGTSGTSSSSGTSSTSGASGTSTPRENYVSQKVKDFKQMSNALSGMLGIDTTVHKPRIAGDKDPDPNATPESKELGGIAVVSNEFLLGQPNQEMEGGSPNVGNLDHDGGVIDNEDGSSWHGPIRTEDPGDVNTAPGGSALKPAATDNTEEDDDDENEDHTNTRTKTQ